jgi:ribosomal protein S18 acetylase RimI-like enzyme
MSTTLEKAEPQLFSVCQTVYSNVDTNLNFIWENRLKDTLWTNDVYWIINDGERIGGVMISEDWVRFPFLVPPYNDRQLLWDALYYLDKHNALKMNKVLGALDCDVPILLTQGYKIIMARRMMCRPAERLPINLGQEYKFRIPDAEKDVDEIASVIENGYKGGIDYEIFGPSEAGEAKADVSYYFDAYQKTNTLYQSVVVTDVQSNKIIGACIAGRHPKENSEIYSFISDIAVLPEYRRKGIAEFMLKYVISNAKKTSQLIGLCVTVGNHAENLYKHLGFFGGPIFTNMEKR